MNMHKEYRRLLRKIIAHPKYRDVSVVPFRRFWSRLSINHLRFILAKLEESLKSYGHDTSDKERGPSAWFAMVWRCPSAGEDVPCMIGHFSKAQVDAFDGSEAHKLCALYVLLVRVLHLRERQAAAHQAAPHIQPMRPPARMKRRRRIPSPKPASPFIYV